MSDRLDASRFQAAVEERFAPVMRRFGFRQAGADGYGVRFERPPACVEVHYDATRSWALDVWLGRGERESGPIDLAHALEVTGCPPEVVGALDPMQTGDEQVLRKLLTRAAEALGGCGAELLGEDGTALERALELREEQAAEYERTDISPRLLEEADAAWAEKDLARLAVVLGPVRDRLPPRYARRLAFAEKRR